MWWRAIFVEAGLIGGARHAGAPGPMISATGFVFSGTSMIGSVRANHGIPDRHTDFRSRLQLK